MTKQNCLADVHIHSTFSKDSKAQLPDICENAIQKNLLAICITDHVDFYPEVSLDTYIRNRQEAGTAIRQIQKEYPDLAVLVGVEIAGGGVFPKRANAIAHCDTFDQIIGSVHGMYYANGKEFDWSADDDPGEVQYFSTAKMDFSQMSEEELVQFVHYYYNAALHAMQRTEMDIMAHLLYPFRYINGKYNRNLDWKQFLPTIEKLLDFMVSHEIALEINTSRFGTAYDDLLQYEEVLRRYLQKGGYLITIGSDAHVCDRLANFFDRAIDMLKRNGIRNLYYFKKRQPHPYPID